MLEICSPVTFASLLSVGTALINASTPTCPDVYPAWTELGEILEKLASIRDEHGTEGAAAFAQALLAGANRPHSKEVVSILEQMTLEPEGRNSSTMADDFLTLLRPHTWANLNASGLTLTDNEVMRLDLSVTTGASCGLRLYSPSGRSRCELVNAEGQEYQMSSLSIYNEEGSPGALVGVFNNVPNLSLVGDSQVRIGAEGGDNGSSSSSMSMTTKGPEAEFSLINQDGVTRLTASVNSDGRPSFSILDDARIPRVQVAFDENGQPRLVFANANGLILATYPK